MITVITPVSVVPSHPDTVILDETIASVRHHLPDAEIILTFDGIRAEQVHRRADYEEFIRRALWKADHQWGNVAPWIFEGHTHQVGMLRAVLDEIRTPLLVYVEQDTPLVTDEPIDFPAISELINSGEANLVRLHHEALILDVHRHMTYGEIPFAAAGGPIRYAVRTSQWSQRPHVASVAYYRRILAAHFSRRARSFIEDKMHSVCDEAYRIDGMNGWAQHRLFVYLHENGPNIKRSLHLDGRAGEPKYDGSQVF